ncbi:protein RGF1 INDUCIBLE TRANSCRIPTION FACTOR 1-like [Primulina eburnea]|uniref:protein RGF1 INDUCIBLE TRANSCRIPTION FACTOR 1-like n=1 Tax=Primulina eburnea TaxID=1245227 RepID=UPI003C6CBAB6
MNISIVEAAKQVENAVERNDDVPQWLYGFLSKTFFDKCRSHEAQKNDLNRYCITCDAIICKFCIISDKHDEHDLLTIYRHVYQDVVPLDQMNNHINCKRIQPYKCNKKWVVSLTPLPHNGSGALIEGDGACIVCRRKLTEPGRFRFCSIACKLEAYTGGENVTISRRGSREGTSSGRAAAREPKNGSYRRRSRKGVPHRSPFSSFTPLYPYIPTSP